MTKAFCALVFWGSSAAAQTVEGCVINSATGLGIAGVEVRIVQAGETVYTAATDSQGHFLIADVKDGSYTVRYSSPDYFPHADLGATRPFQVTAGGNPVKLEAHMMPLASLTGHVVDGKGEAVPNARLELTGSGAVMRLATDSHGKFELRRLLPDAYTLSAVPPPGLKPPDPEPESDRARAWTRTYYPGVAVREAASRIVLRPGGEVLDIELKLLAVPAHAVRGVLLNPDGKPVPNAKISLGEGFLNPLAFRVVSELDGTFVFPAVADGEWGLSASLTSEGVLLKGAQWIEMEGHEIEGEKLRLSRPFSVRGRIVMNAPKGAPPPKPPSVTLVWHVSRNGLTLGPRLGSPSQPDTDGIFQVDNVYPGVYRIVADDPPPPYYLDAILLGEAEPATGDVELSSGAVPITLVYKTDGGTVRGIAQKCASGGVQMVPKDGTLQRPGFLRWARCDSNDHYEIDAVRPGEYYALALTGNSWPWDATDLDDDFLNQASRVTVRTGETSSADLRAITRPAY